MGLKEPSPSLHPRPSKPPKGGEVWPWLLAAPSEGSSVVGGCAKPRAVVGLTALPWFRVVAQSCPELFVLGLFWSQALCKTPGVMGRLNSLKEPSLHLSHEGVFAYF